MAVGDVYEVTASILRVRVNPSLTSEVIGGIARGRTVKEISTRGNWLQHADGWSSLTYLKKVSSAPKVTTVVQDNTTITKEQQQTLNEEAGLDTDGSTGAEVDPDTVTNMNSVKRFTRSAAENFNEIDSFIGTFGIPYQFLPTADPRIDSGGTLIGGNNTGIGYEYADKIASKIPLMFIAPGRPNFMTKYKGSDKKNVLEKIIKDYSLRGDESSTLGDLIDSDGRYYTFEYAVPEYYSYVNPMCRIAARYLELHDFVLGGKHMDRVDWRTYTMNNIHGFMETTTYANIPFYVDTDTSVSEDFGNSLGESSLATSVNGVSDLGREMRFLTGYGSEALDMDWFKQNPDTLNHIENINDEINKILGKGNFLSNLTKHLNTVASGGRLIFPKIWTDSDVGRSYNVKIKLTAPDCNKLSIFLNILVPLFHLIGLVAPQTIPTNPNGYTNPFIVRAMYKSFFNVDMGIITSMSVERGGNCQWTVDGLPTSLEVSMTIKDLYDVLTISPTSSRDWSYDTMSNTAQMDYIANLCGINMYKPEIGRQISMWLVNTTNRIGDIPLNVWSNINTKVGEKILNTFRL